MDQDKNRRTKFVGVSLFVPILTLSIALLALVQGQAAGRSGLALTMMAAQTNSITSNSLLFSPAVTYNAGGAFSMSAAVADLNGDGKPDVIVGNFPGPLGILLGRGDGTFQPVVRGGVSGAFSVAVADLNLDGKLDLVNTRYGDIVGTVQVQLGNGDGTFQPAVTYNSGGAFSTGIAIADVNRDGKPDLIVANSMGAVFGGLVGVLLGNGDGTFQPVVIYDSLGGDAWSVAVADVNADGKPDLVIANLCSKTTCATGGVLTVLLGQGNGTFQASNTYNSGGSQATAMILADVNGDHILDIVVANSMSGNVAVLLGYGNGTFQKAVTDASGGILMNGPQSIAVADVNGDGKVDLVAINCADTGRSYCGLWPGVVGVLLGNGDGTFRPVVTYDSGGKSGAGVAAADVNGDGKLDLIVTNYCADVSCGSGSMGVLLNHPGAIDTTPPIITMSVSTRFLSPVTGKMVPVHISGIMNDTGSGIKPGSAEFAVSDEYQHVQPYGKITLDSAGHYSFTIQLQASREAADLDGRTYMIRVSARNNAGLWTGKWARVRVPHGD